MADDPFIGRVKVNKETGERSMWMGASKGFMAVDQNNIPVAKRYTPEVQSALDDTQTAYNKAQALTAPAIEFQRYNREVDTGPLRGLVAKPFSGKLQSLDGITNAMIRSQIQPGTSGASNTGAEQERLRNMFPNVDTFGGVNDERVRRIKIDRDLQLERMQMIQKWAANGGRNIADFESMWVQHEAKRRAALDQYYQSNAKPIGGAPSGVKITRVK
ncbi:MAG: hypothetical protein EBR82_40000 [Caulobacteraceae bacterium]|nr:hypothetical protein [Caulobacteraceae bacterium]